MFSDLGHTGGLRGSWDIGSGVCTELSDQVPLTICSAAPRQGDPGKEEEGHQAAI